MTEAEAENVESVSRDQIGRAAGCAGTAALALSCGGNGAAAGLSMRPPPGLRDFQLRIGRDGTWYYRGSPIQRKAMVCLFASVLRRESDGGYWLETPVERGPIEVEDVPFIAVEMYWRDCGGRQCLTFRTNLDELVTADHDHPIRVALDPESGEPRPYVTVRPGLEARIGRAVFYEMVALGQCECIGGRDILGVWSEGVFFPIDEVPALDAAAE